LDENKKIAWNWSNDLRIVYYNRGNANFYYKNSYYDNSGKKYLFNKSVCIEGQDGFCLEQKTQNLARNQLFRTFDGGKSWFSIGLTNAPFDIVNSFDLVTKDMIFACVNRYMADGRTQGESLEMSLDAGRTWRDIYDAAQHNYMSLRPNHVFFLNELVGWISSDNDDGLFLTINGGRAWTSIQIPERIATGIFFKDAKRGRIICGVSNNIYETTDGGRNWRLLHKSEILSESFNDYFSALPLSRWNNFAMRRTLSESLLRK
jgi:photosystem II stability/assembly factor-like uncharacterized protein